jgi:cytochrome c oxidase subunit 2
MRRAQHRAGHRARVAGVVLVGTMVLAGCGSYPGATVQSRDVHHLYNILFVVATIIFVLVEGAIIVAALRYRRRDDQLPPQFHGNNLLEISWTVVPLLIVATLFWLSWQVLNKVDAQADNPAVTVNVTGFQWQWQFTFQGEKVRVEEGQPPQDLTLKGTIARPPTIYLPVDQTIHFNLQSRDVIHGFYIPQFLFKRDVIPGRTNSFDLTIDKPGSYPGQCTQFCGLQHNAMHFTVKAVPLPEYRAWIAKARKQAESGCPNDPTPGQIAAKNTAFDKDCLAAKAGQPFQLRFDNQEALPHNVAIRKGNNASGAPVPIPGNTPFAGPKVVTYNVPALAKGNYFFLCEVHPTAMTGKLVVK